MDSELEKKIAERLAELPEEVQAALSSGDVPTHIRTIGEAHQLHIDQIATLEDETMLVMLGFLSPDEFVSSVAEHLHITPEDAETIAGEISEQLFVPIHESMQKFMEARAAATTEKEEMLPEHLPSQPTKPAVEMPSVDRTLSQKTISTPLNPAQGAGSGEHLRDALAPNTYKTDPYREPPE